MNNDIKTIFKRIILGSHTLSLNFLTSKVLFSYLSIILTSFFFFFWNFLFYIDSWNQNEARNAKFYLKQQIYEFFWLLQSRLSKTMFPLINFIFAIFKWWNGFKVIMFWIEKTGILIQHTLKKINVMNRQIFKDLWMVKV